MFELVLGAFVAALTPTALGFAWKLICGAGRSTEMEPEPPFESARTTEVIRLRHAKG